MSHYIIGTAGHIDHGKTTLTKALTGKDTDRLQEERQRAISIELGFAPFVLPNGEQASIVDVPGHERFIRQMVAGVAGMDLVLLVIAADEGIMPQTQEHLQIIELLGIQHGIVVLTKIDNVDKELLELVREEVTDYLKDSIFANSPICAVSSTTGEGIEALKQTIQQELKKVPPRTTTGFFFEPVDRVFSLKGIGTVVTGTIYSGIVSVGDELELMPQQKKVRIRSLQVHDRPVEKAEAGQRCALNVTGLNLEEVERGNTLTTVGEWQPTRRVDIEFQYLKDLDFATKHRHPVKLHIGTSEITGNILFFDRKEVLPGEKVYCQLELAEPIVASRGDRFILRRPTPPATIGGGRIIEPYAEKHKYRPETIKALKQKSEGRPEDLILQQLGQSNHQVGTLRQLNRLLNLPEYELVPLLQTLIQDGSVIQLNLEQEEFYTTRTFYTHFCQTVDEYLAQFHKNFPLRKGAPRAEILQQFAQGLPAKAVQALVQHMEKEGVIKIFQETVSRKDFQPSLKPTLQKTSSDLLNLLEKSGLTPGDWRDLCTKVNISSPEQDELLSYLLDQKKVVKLTNKLVLHCHVYRDATQKLIEAFQHAETFSIQDVKEIFPLSRKYLVPLLEKWDEEKVTLPQTDKSRIIHPSVISKQGNDA